MWKLSGNELLNKLLFYYNSLNIQLPCLFELWWKSVEEHKNF